MIHSFTVTFGAKYLIGMVTSVLLKIIFFISLETTKFTLKNQIPEICDPLGHIGHVTYNFINMLLISTGIFYDKLCSLILSVGTTPNSPLNCNNIYIPT